MSVAATYPSPSLSERLKALSEHGRKVYWGNRKSGESVLVAYARALRAERAERRQAK